MSFTSDAMDTPPALHAGEVWHVRHSLFGDERSRLSSTEPCESWHAEHLPSLNGRHAKDFSI